MENILFISHANPEDNEFTLWLASRLRLMGYNAWCDIEKLLGGEITWDEIDDIIRNKSVKFLFVVSKHLCKEPGKLRKGVQDEFRLAESLTKTKGKEFVIPLKIDDVPHNFYIGLNTYNNISFFNNWADGLKQLVKKLEKDNVSKSDKPDSRAFIEWYENEYTTQYGIVKKKEKYYSNWWEIKSLPENFYIYRYQNDHQAKVVLFLNKQYPAIQQKNNVITFVSDILESTNDNTAFGGQYEIEHSHRIKVPIKAVLDRTYKNESFPTLRDAETLLKWLLNRTFEHLMQNKYLAEYELSGRKKCFYFTRPHKEKVSFTYKNKKKTKNVNGKYQITKEKHGFWHVAMSARTQLYPILGYNLKTHLYFSDDGLQAWTDKKKQHSARRKKGKRWFNEEWRDIMLAFINALKDDDGEINVDLTDSFSLKMPEATYNFDSEIGYNEPSSKDRQLILENDDPEENTEE